MGYLKEGDPARYHLATTESGIQIAVNKKAVPKPSDFPPEGTGAYAKQLKLPGAFFQPSADREWGYDGSITTMDMQHPDWVLYECPLYPAFNDDGKQDYDRVYSSAASLKLLFDALSDSDKDSNARVPQNLVVRLALDRTRDMWGSPISVSVYPPLAEFIGSKLSKRGHTQVETTMRNLFYKMWNHKEDEEDRLFDNTIRVIPLRGNLIYLQTFGNACDLGPEMNSATGQEGSYEMTPHNTDNPMQQLDLLAGIAKIEELKTRAYFRKNPNQLKLGLK